MATVTQGPLRGNVLPDYHGGSTVNLMASLIGARGGHSPHAPLEGLDTAPLSGARNLYYLVLDGLGLAQLRRHLDAGQGQRFFAAHPHRGITTVFPATTAAAITTFDTGASPTEHGILSWFLHLPDLGVASTVLRTTSRIGAPLFPEGFDLRAYYDIPSHVQTVDGPLGLLSWGDIPYVPFGKTGTQWGYKDAYGDLEGLVASVASFDAAHEGGLSYVYWPRYDGLCHELGCLSPEVTEHFDLLDQTLAKLVDTLAGSGSTVCVLADHGLVDVEPENCHDLADIPGLVDCLAVAPTGDQRQVSAFVRPGRVERFLERVRTHLGEACVCMPGEDLLEMGAFGPGTPHRALANRLGDYVLLARDGHALIHTPPGFERFYQRGSHGGMSGPEIQIPLFVVQP